MRTIFVTPMALITQIRSQGDAVLGEHAVLKKKKESERAHDGRGAGGAALVLTIPFVGNVVEHKNAVEDGVVHAGFSNWKI